MKKKELEEHARAYHSLIAHSQQCRDLGLYCDSVDSALRAWDYMDGMMQYERRYLGRKFDTLDAVEIVLADAPLLLDFESLVRLESMLKKHRRLETNTTDDIGAKLTSARSTLRDCHCLWGYLERSGEVPLELILDGLDLDIHPARRREIIEGWQRMGLVRRTFRDGRAALALCTRMGELVKGKCGLCGAICEAPKAVFLEESACPCCGVGAEFTLVAATSHASESDR